MLSQDYDSYGYKPNTEFITYNSRKGLEYPKINQVQKEYTEMSSFFSEERDDESTIAIPIIQQMQ